LDEDAANSILLLVGDTHLDCIIKIMNCILQLNGNCTHAVADLLKQNDILSDIVAHFRQLRHATELSNKLLCINLLNVLRIKLEFACSIAIQTSSTIQCEEHNQFVDRHLHALNLERIINFPYFPGDCGYDALHFLIPNCPPGNELRVMAMMCLKRDIDACLPYAITATEYFLQNGTNSTAYIKQMCMSFKAGHKDAMWIDAIALQCVCKVLSINLNIWGRHGIMQEYRYGSQLNTVYNLAHVFIGASEHYEPIIEINSNCRTPTILPHHNNSPIQRPNSNVTTINNIKIQLTPSNKINSDYRSALRSNSIAKAQLDIAKTNSQFCTESIHNRSTTLLPYVQKQLQISSNILFEHILQTWSASTKEMIANVQLCKIKSLPGYCNASLHERTMLLLPTIQGMQPDVTYQTLLKYLEEMYTETNEHTISLECITERSDACVMHAWTDAIG
jgi:hypothetical protein